MKANEEEKVRSRKNEQRGSFHHDPAMIDPTVRIPPLRSDLEILPVSKNGVDLIYIVDSQGYMDQPLVLGKPVSALLPMLNGHYSVRDIVRDLRRYGADTGETELQELVMAFDKAGLLLSPSFQQRREKIEERFEKRKLRPAVCAGVSYPANAADLRAMLKRAFEETERVPVSFGRIRALFAPHIDTRVNLSVYASGFRYLAALKPKRVVILATSHYSGGYHPLYNGLPYIGSHKDFSTPLGVVPADLKAIRDLAAVAGQTGLSFRDRAHRSEHSIELHLVFLQYMWSHPFAIVPILVGSLEDLYYMREGDTGKKVDAMTRELGNRYAEDDETLFLISGDLAHIGKKFGDRQSANSMYDDMCSYDRLFLGSAARGRADELLSLQAEYDDAYRICGFPPLYTALQALPEARGTITGYDIWDDREQESAVSFCSIIYSDGAR